MQYAGLCQKFGLQNPTSSNKHQILRDVHVLGVQFGEQEIHDHQCAWDHMGVSQNKRYFWGVPLWKLSYIKETLNPKP